MVDTIERVVTVYEANVSRFGPDTKRAVQIFDRGATDIERRNDQLTRRLNAGFRGLNIDSLIGRYTAWGAVIGGVQRLVRESIEVNEQAAASWERLEETFSKLANMAGPSVASFFDELNDIIKRDMRDLEKLAALWERIRVAAGGMPDARTGGIPFASAATPFAGFDKRSGNWTTSPLGFPVSGVTDITPKKADTVSGKTVAEREREIYLDTMRALEDLIATRHKADADFRQQQGEIAQDLRNRTGRSVVTGLSVEEIDGIEDFWDRAAGAEEQYWARVTDERMLEQDMVADRIARIGDAFEYMAGAALQGGDAFKRALAGMVQSLAPSGLRSLFEAGLTSLAGGGGFLGNLVSGFGGFRAAGGDVSPFKTYAVGEKGIELFRPKVPGTIIPNAAIGSAGAGGVNVFLTQNMSLAANGDAQVAAIARAAAAEGAQGAIRYVQKNFKAMSLQNAQQRM